MTIDTTPSLKALTTDELLATCEQSMSRYLGDDIAGIEHLNSGGSRTRARICLHAGQKLSLNFNDTICTAAIVELLHNASLIHDDVQDCDVTRRGSLTTWKKYGKPHAICAGDNMITSAFGAIADISASAKIPDIIKETKRAVAETIRGQINDLQATSAITASQYESIAAMKSGPLFRLALALPLTLGNRRDLLPKVDFISSFFAIAYQINDDLNDFVEDGQNGQLNLINILSQDRSQNEAIVQAKSRAQYLLRKCLQELSQFPNDSVDIVIAMAKKLFSEVEKYH